MKLAFLIAALVLAASSAFPAEGPVLSIYQILRQSDTPSRAGAELIMKVYNRPGRAYYVIGLSMADVPYVIEVQKGGKWIAAPRPKSLLEARLRPFLPDSYLVFDVPIQIGAEDTTFRVRVFIYTSGNEAGIYPGSTDNQVVELVSTPFSTKELR